jgi:hypothetical protein
MRSIIIVIIFANSIQFFTPRKRRDMSITTFMFLLLNRHRKKKTFFFCGLHVSTIKIDYQSRE